MTEGSAGCWNGTQLLEEVKKLGYTGSDALFRLFITSVRKHHQATGTSAKLSLDADGAKVSGPLDPACKSSIKHRLSPARASWLYISQVAKLDEKQQQQVQQIRAAHSELDSAYVLTQEFVYMLAEHRDRDLDEWLARAKHSGIKELKSFAYGVQRDSAAVSATFTSEWSNGPVEAQVNCLKLQKRLMSAAPILTFYGCTSCDVHKCSSLCILDPLNSLLFISVLIICLLINKQAHLI